MPEGGGIAMRREYQLRLQRGTGLAAFLVILAAIAGWVLWAGGAKHPEMVAASRAALRRPTGSAQLISSDPLPEPAEDGETCEWVPASASSSLFAALQEEALSSGKAARSSDAGSPADFSKLKPVRTIND